MKLYYNLWQSAHYTNLDDILLKLVSLKFTGVNIINAISIKNLTDIFPIKDAGGFIKKEYINEIISKCKDKGLKVILKPQVHIRDSQGLKPSWWPGWVGLLWNKKNEDAFFNMYYHQCLKPLYEYENKNKIDGVIIGTELTSLASSPVWNRVYNTLRTTIPKRFQDKTFSITYAHIFWSPILKKRLRLLRRLKFWVGSKTMFKLLLTNKEWVIPEKYQSKLADKILAQEGRISCWDKMDTVGLSMYPIFCYDKAYNNVEERFRNYEIDYKYKLFWWTIRGKVKIDYFQDILEWSDKKSLVITEGGIQYFWDTLYNKAYQAQYWSTVFRLFGDKASSIGIWDDASYNKSVLFEALEDVLNAG